MKRNNIVTTALMFILIGTVAFACKKKDIEQEEPITTVATAEEFRNFVQQTFDSKIQRASFNAEDGYTFTSSKGVVLQLFPNSLTLNGQPVTGQVDLEFAEFFGRGSLAVCNVTTVGLNANNEKDILTSGGTFHIKVFQNGNELEMNSGMMLKVPSSLTGGLNPSMKPFVGDEDANGNLTWIELFGSDFFVLTSDNTYNAFLANFGWFNCDIFIPFPDKGTINVQVPEGYNAQNATVFASVMNMPNTLSCLFTGIDAYPLNQTVHLIFMSVQNNQYVYAIKTLTVQEENNVVFASDELHVTTEANLTQIVNDLP